MFSGYTSPPAGVFFALCMNVSMMGAFLAAREDAKAHPEKHFYPNSIRQSAATAGTIKELWRINHE
jgi:hypothetical protein